MEKFYDELGMYPPRLVSVACEEVVEMEERHREFEESEAVRRQDFEQQSLARVQKSRVELAIATEQRDSVLAIAGIVFPPVAVPAAAADNASEGSGDDKGRWIKKGTSYKISQFLATRIAEIDEGTRTSPTASVSWKSGKHNPHHRHTDSIIQFWQKNGPMTDSIARERWASVGGSWEHGGLRGAMRELIKQEILVPV